MNMKSRSHEKKYEVLPEKIRRTKTLHADTIYIVSGEVQVMSKACIHAEDKVTILIENGIFKKSRLKRSAFIFNPGSSLNAKNLILRAADSEHQIVKKADNAGIWFLGSSSDASKDGISIKRKKNSRSSEYYANSINTKYLGQGDGLSNKQDDVDGISILGIAKHEWQIKKVISQYSGDDGIDITNSHICIDTLEVTKPSEDGINLSSSRLEIHKKLSIDTSKSGIRDRDLFDFEADDGASYLEIRRSSKVELRGVFGDQLKLVSEQMPRAITKLDNERTYKFQGTLKESALIYTIDKD